SVGDTGGDGIPDLVAGAGDASLGCLLSGYAAILHPVVPPEQRKVMLTEVHWGGAQAVEITSFATVPVDLGGWRVAWDDGSQRLSSPFPANTIIAPGEAIIVRELVITCIGCPPVT